MGLMTPGPNARRSFFLTQSRVWPIEMGRSASHLPTPAPRSTHAHALHGLYGGQPAPQGHLHDIGDALVNWWNLDHANILNSSFYMGLFCGGLLLCSYF